MARQPFSFVLIDLLVKHDGRRQWLRLQRASGPEADAAMLEAVRAAGGRKRRIWRDQRRPGAQRATATRE